ncbi:MAG TPA: hypothetical protein VG737_11035 [Cyclobacteriaceae bacterium]|nr:hypothetical protein [Cyclobacteriaceae bacterium]
MKKLFIAILLFLPFASICQPAYYDVLPGIGNGYRFYQDNTYKISVGIGTEYVYGPVTDYSMRSGMDATAGRGWVWGIGGQAPSAALNNQGVLKIAGSFYTGPYMGSASVVGRIASSGPTSEFSLTNRAVSSWVEIPTQGERWVVYSDGTATDGTLRFWSGADKVTLTKQGNLGIGVGLPSGKLHTATNSSNTSYSGLVSGDISLALQNTSNTNNNLNVLSFLDASNWGIAHIGATVPSQSGHTGRLFFSTRPSGGGNLVQRMVIDENGYVGIGSLNPSQMLTVNGAIYGKQVKVDLSVPGPDYVFEKSYSLPTLDAVKSYIEENKHLPEVPSANEMEAKGIDVGEMNMLLLKKVEELTLYVIELKKESEKQQVEIENLKQIIVKGSNKRK